MGNEHVGYNRPALVDSPTRWLFTTPAGMDPELAKLNLLVEIVGQLDPGYRERILQYLMDRFKEGDG